MRRYGKHKGVFFMLLKYFVKGVLIHFRKTFCHIFLCRVFYSKRLLYHLLFSVGTSKYGVIDIFWRENLDDITIWGECGTFSSVISPLKPEEEWHLVWNEKKLPNFALVRKKLMYSSSVISLFCQFQTLQISSFPSLLNSTLFLWSSIVFRCTGPNSVCLNIFLRTVFYFFLKKCKVLTNAILLGLKLITQITFDFLQAVI